VIGPTPWHVPAAFFCFSCFSCCGHLALFQQLALMFLSVTLGLYLMLLQLLWAFGPIPADGSYVSFSPRLLWGMWPHPFRWKRSNDVFEHTRIFGLFVKLFVLFLVYMFLFVFLVTIVRYSGQWRV